VIRGLPFLTKRVLLTMPLRKQETKGLQLCRWGSGQSWHPGSCFEPLRHQRGLLVADLYDSCKMFFPETFFLNTSHHRQTQSPRTIYQNMGLFNSHKPKPAAHGGPKQKRNAPNLDRQRALAQSVGNPRAFWQEAAAARYDVDTLALIARPVPAHAGVMTLEALHGGEWTKEELAFSKAIKSAKENLDSGIGMAQECCVHEGGRSNPGMDDAIRDTANAYQKLVQAWRAFYRTKDKTWAGRVADQVGDLAGTALGLI
jgi:hypothetical protein